VLFAQGNHGSDGSAHRRKQPSEANRYNEI
jgi:hypothetical protein